ncbi:MAG: hypothetical protein AAB880_01480 [Patescibacteria group bacterium]
MTNPITNKDTPASTRNDIATFINERLGKYEEVEKIFIEQKGDDVFEVVVITKKISPSFEKSLIELEDTVQEKYNVPSYFKTFSNASATAALLTQ